MTKRYVILDISGVLIIHDKWGNTKTNKELIDYLISQKDKFVYVLVTNNPPEIQHHIKAVYGIPKFYEHFISSQTYNLSKSDQKLYQEVLVFLFAKPEQCIFVDDTPSNVAAAQEAGMTAFVYQNFEQFKKDLARAMQQPGE